MQRDKEWQMKQIHLDLANIMFKVNTHKYYSFAHFHTFNFELDKNKAPLGTIGRAERSHPSNLAGALGPG
jgi:hypothetical protein